MKSHFHVKILCISFPCRYLGFHACFNSINLTVVFLTMYTNKLSCLIWRRAHSWQKVVVFFRNVRAYQETSLSAVFQLTRSLALDRRMRTCELIVKRIGSAGKFTCHIPYSCLCKSTLSTHSISLDVKGCSFKHRFGTNTRAFPSHCMQVTLL